MCSSDLPGTNPRICAQDMLMPTQLHVGLQEYYAGDTGQVEVRHGRYRLDVLRDGVAYEIQTGSFFKISDKIDRLADQMPVVVVWPVPRTKVIVRVDPETGAEVSARRSPKQGRIAEIFPELGRMAKVLAKKTVSLEVVWTAERELRTPETRRGRYHRRASLIGRELVEVLEVQRFAEPEDYLALLPANLPSPFTVADLAQAQGVNRWLAGQIAYGLHNLGAIVRVGKRGNAYLHETVKPLEPAGDAGDWVPVSCADCGTVGLDARPGSVVRWRCPGCRSLQVWPAGEVSG